MESVGSSLCVGGYLAQINRTTSMPKSVLHYDVDKDLTLVWSSVFTKSCFPNKGTDRQRRVKPFIL